MCAFSPFSQELGHRASIQQQVEMLSHRMGEDTISLALQKKVNKLIVMKSNVVWCEPRAFSWLCMCLRVLKRVCWRFVHERSLLLVCTLVSVKYYPGQKKTQPWSGWWCIKSKSCDIEESGCLIQQRNRERTGLATAATSRINASRRNQTAHSWISHDASPRSFSFVRGSTRLQFSCQQKLLCVFELWWQSADWAGKLRRFPTVLLSNFSRAN